jgi:hypothetical protein
MGRYRSGSSRAIVVTLVLFVVISTAIIIIEGRML